MRKHHHAIATAHNTTTGAEDPNLHIMMSHHDTVIAQDTGEEVDGPNLLGTPMTTRMRKSRWGHHASPAGFT
jgi:hypothetical protein